VAAPVRVDDRGNRRHPEVFMFVQVIEGHTADPDGLRRQGERWMSDLRPGAIGFLGATVGTSEDGRHLTIARFESADAAQANSNRPEQGQWWAETEKFYDGEVTFSDSDEIDLLLGGGSDDAGFVQVMKGKADRAQVRRMDEQFEKHAPSFRPDVLGGLRAWTGPDTYIEVAYFTSEADARENEQNEPPAELMGDFADFQELMAGVEFIDLKDPQLF
jgi:hypothetical protein